MNEYNDPKDDWGVMVRSDGTAGILSLGWAWQEFLCDPEEALMRRDEDDGA